MAVVLGPGATLGPFEIISPLQSGGMASLFLARRLEPLGHAEPVALKVVRPHLARDPGHVAMFIEEARLGERLVHPHIVRTEALGLDRGVHYLAMEFVNGVSLAQLIAWLIQNGRGLTPTLAVHIAISVARALDFAHCLRDDAGNLLDVVHRDVSPQNILLSHHGEVKLIDFGIAKARGRNWATAQGSLKGKLGYMSPEQARAEPLDRRTDVYALGVVLWEMLTHRRLFFGEPAELLERLQHPSVVLPRSIVPSIPQPLEDVVMRALHPSREQRFAGADELESALTLCHDGASGLDLAALGALVALAMEEVRTAEDLDPTAKDALRVSLPTGAIGAEALHQFTREIARPAVPLPISPPTRVALLSTPPLAAPPWWRPWLVLFSSLSLGVGLLSIAGVVGAGSWFLLTQKEPEPAALAMPTPAPAAPMAPIPRIPEATAPPPLPAAVPTEIAAAARESPAPAPVGRRRRRAPAPPEDPAETPALATHLPTAPAEPATPGVESPLDVPAAPPTRPRVPVRLPPGTLLDDSPSMGTAAPGDHE